MFRIIVLAAMGLGAMYMMHLLAQDFNRIRRPIQNAVRSFIYKRDLTQTPHPAAHREPVTFDGAVVNWNRILHNDPLNCALLLVCELAGGADVQTGEADNIIAFVRHSVHIGAAPPKILTAYNRGRSKRASREHCYADYLHCPYSASTMLHLLNIHAYLFRSDDPPPDAPPQ